jgi:hypothetical protein
MVLFKLAKHARSEADPKVLRSGPSSLGTADQLARGLGWLGIGLGVAQLLAPQRFTQSLGMHGMEPLVRICGAREIASGMLTLSTEKKLGLWTRVGGDVFDVATLALALGAYNPRRENVKLALAATLGVTVLDILALQGIRSRHRRRYKPVRDYRDRSGFPSGLEGVRSNARSQGAGPDGDNARATVPGSA